MHFTLTPLKAPVHSVSACDLLTPLFFTLDGSEAEVSDDDEEELMANNEGEE